MILSYKVLYPIRTSKQLNHQTIPPSFVKFQDRATGRMIGRGVQHSGLYFLVESPKADASYSSKF